jgi:hypothetical protein
MTAFVIIVLTVQCAGVWAAIAAWVQQDAKSQ